MTKVAQILFTALAALALAGPAPAATTIKIATIVPDGTGWMKDMRAAAAEIEQRSEGRVKFKLYAGGVQGTDAQVLRKMRIGQLHGGAFTNGGMRLFHPDAEIYGLPMMFRNLDEITLCTRTARWRIASPPGTGRLREFWLCRRRPGLPALAQTHRQPR